VYEDVTVAVDTEFEALFRDVFPRLVSLGALKTGRVDVARDLAQETMTRAHARWDELATYDAPAAWCRTVMVNLLIDHHRSRAAEQRAVDRLSTADTTVVAAADPTPSLDEWNELVAPLPERQRMIVTLYYADDLTVGQIAQLLDTSRGAIKASLFKARRTLRNRLDEEHANG
jgi:RNA polymerase sigma-70 factor, ECF subfamily